MQVRQLIKVILWVAGILGVFAASAAIAGEAAKPDNLGNVASIVKGNLGQVAQLITAGAYVAGFGFAVAAIVKFKAHKDNPNQIHISQPIVLLFVAAALMFAPSVFNAAGGTVFGTDAKTAGVAGTYSF